MTAHLCAPCNFVMVIEYSCFLSGDFVFSRKSFNWSMAVAIFFLQIPTNCSTVGKIYAYYWLIPVSTGNMRTLALNSSRCSVYPCVYREHFITNDFAQIEVGLSLCIQGTYVNSMFIIKFYPVYPCVYREHPLFTPATLAITGLSLCIQGTYNVRSIRYD